MLHQYVKNTVWFMGLALLQVLLLNNIHILGYATPFLYIYFIVQYEISVSRNTLMLLAFSLGLFVDVFSDTPGINAAASVSLAFLRPFYLRLFMPRDAAEDISPSLTTLGIVPYLKYLFISVLSHHLVLYLLMFFSFADVQLFLLKVIGSVLLSFMCVIGLEWIRK